MKLSYTISTILLCFCFSITNAQLSGWQYKRNVYLSHTNSSTLTDFQVKLTINTAQLISTGKLKSDGSDLRFTNAAGDTILPYFIESGINTFATQIWVKIPNFLPSGTMLQMHYGNISANSLSNGNNTFVFFDDFEGSALDSSKWVTGKDATVVQSVTGGINKYSGAGYAVFTSKNMGITAPFVVHTKVNGFSAYSYDLCAVGYATDAGNFTRTSFFSGLALRVGNTLTSFGDPVSITAGTSAKLTSCDTIYQFKSTVMADGQCNIQLPNGSIETVNASQTTTKNATRVSFHYFYNPGNATGVCSQGRKYEQVFVTKYAFSSPIIDSIGTEQNKTTTSDLKLTTTLPIQIYPNPSNGNINIISKPQGQTPLILTLIDINGKIVHKTLITSPLQTIQLSELNKGIYIVKVMNDETTFTTRILLN